VFTLNPTAANPNDMILFRGYHYLLPNIYYHFKFTPSIHTGLGPILSCGTYYFLIIFNSFSYLNSWGIFALVKDGNEYRYSCSLWSIASWTAPAPFSIPFDNTLEFGGTSTGHDTFDGLLKDFKFYSDVISNQQILHDMN
jgi:hypothetical protein